MAFAHVAANETSIRVALSRKTTIRQLVLRADGDRPRRGEYARRAPIEVARDELSDVGVVDAADIRRHAYDNRIAAYRGPLFVVLRRWWTKSVEIVLTGVKLEDSQCEGVVVLGESKRFWIEPVSEHPSL